MKKLLLPFLLSFFVGTSLNAQTCNPSQLAIIAGIPGIFPVPTDPLPDGDLNQPYSETLTIIVPDDTTIDLSALIGFSVPPVTVDINHEKINSVTGLPNGVTYACDTSNCTWGAGGNGCILLSGTPTENGSFTVDLDVILNVQVPQGVPVIGGTAVDAPLPVTYDYDVQPVIAIEDEIDPTRMKLVGASPNPADQYAQVKYEVVIPAQTALTLTDLTGRKVFAAQMYSSTGVNQFEVETSSIPAGIYIAKLNDGVSEISSKLVITH